MKQVFLPVFLVLVAISQSGACEPKLRDTLQGHSDGVQPIIFSSDGKILASAGYNDKTIKLWDVATGKNTAAFDTSRVLCIAFSPDGKLVASVGLDGVNADMTQPSNHDVKLWEVATGKNITTLRRSIEFPIITSVAFSPDSKMLATGCLDMPMQFGDLMASKDTYTLELWDLATAEKIPVFRGHLNTVSCVVFHPDGKMIASAEGSDIKLWDVATGKNIATLNGHPGISTSMVITSIAFSPDGEILVSGDDERAIKLWDVSSGKNIATLKGHRGPVFSVAFSPDGTTVASGSVDETIRFWEVAAGKNIATIKGQTGGVLSVAFSPDGKTLASGNADHTIKLWDICEQQRIKGIKN